MIFIKIFQVVGEILINLVISKVVGFFLSFLKSFPERLILSGLSGLKFQLEIPIRNSSWTANWIFQLEILTEISSGRCKLCYPAGNSNWSFQLRIPKVFFSWKSNFIFYLEISVKISRWKI